MSERRLAAALSGLMCDVVGLLDSEGRLARSLVGCQPRNDSNGAGITRLLELVRD